MQTLVLEDGEVLVREGDVNTHLHLLQQGRIRAERSLDQAQIILYEMRIGVLAGTRAFVDGTPRRATMRAVGGATLYALAPEDFDALVEAYPRLVLKAMRAVFRMTYINLRKYAHLRVVEQDSLWHWLSVAKHYGLPTRFPDWTDSRFVTLHFATARIDQFDRDGVGWSANYLHSHELVPDRLRSSGRKGLFPDRLPAHGAGQPAYLYDRNGHRL